MSKKKPLRDRYLVRVVDQPDGKFVSLWLVRRDGPADAACLFGEVLPAIAREILIVLDLPTERHTSMLPGIPPMTPPGCADLAKQQSLFAKEGDQSP